MPDKRNQAIDIARGLAMICVVVAHAGMPGSVLMNRFHMALFFFLSGMTVSERYLASLRSVGQFIWRRIKGLYFPFVAFNAAFYLLYNWLIRLHVLTDNPAFLQAPAFGGGNQYGIVHALSRSEIVERLLLVLRFQGESQLGGALWFLRVLFGISCTWCVLNWLLKSVLKVPDGTRKGANLVLGVLFVMIAYALQCGGVGLPGQFDTVMASYLMYVLGTYVGPRPAPVSGKNAALTVAIALAALMACSVLCSKMGWNCSVNEIGNPYMFLLTSALGITAAYYLAVLLDRARWSAAIALLGRHTLFILLYQFAAFKLVNLLQCRLYDLPLYRVASFPVLESGHGWWLAYSAVGLFVPAAVSVVWSQCKKSTRRLLRAQRGEKKKEQPHE
jgi:fucose 4-O-acetylase-like acetyltransferase